MTPKEIRWFLSLIYPYLVSKKRQAEILLEMRRRIEEREGIEMVYRNITHGHKSNSTGTEFPANCGTVIGQMKKTINRH